MTFFSAKYGQRLLLTVFLVLFGAYLLLAALTYTPFDPGWTHVSSDMQAVTNASGLSGAWLADFLYGFLGRAALLVPVMVVLEAIQLWWPHSFVTRPVRLLAQAFVVMIVAALCSLHVYQPTDTMANASGGILGYELAGSLLGLANIWLVTAFLCAMALLMVTLAFGIRWGKTFDAVGQLPALLHDLIFPNQPDNTERPANASHSNFSADHSDLDQSAAVHVSLDVASGAASDVVSDTSAHAVADVVSDDWSDAAFDHGVDHNSSPDPMFAQDAHQNADGSPDTAAALASTSSNSISNSPVLPTVPSTTTQPQQRIAPAFDWDDQDVIHDLLQAMPAATPVSAADPFDAVLNAFDSLPAAAVPAVAPVAVPAVAPVVSTAQVATIETATPVSTPRADHAAVDEADEAPAPASDSDQDLAFNQWLAGLAADETATAAPQSQQAAAPEAVSDVPAAGFVATQRDQAPLDPLSVDQASVDQAPVAVVTSTTDDFSADQDVDTDLAIGTDTNADALGAVAATEHPSLKINEAVHLDWDAALTDATGRPMSRALQLAEKRATLSPLPSMDLLDLPDPNRKPSYTEEELQRLSELLEIKLQEFNIKGQVMEAQLGPVVTRFELQLAAGVKASKVTNISRDLARSMSMASVRVVEVIAGKPYIGIEVPNRTREMVRLIELLSAPAYRDPNALISIAMGKDIAGRPVLADLAKAPHMLVAGTTGSGKSVAVNAMLLSMLLKYSPEQLRLILIDPKQLELANYGDIPHLLTPVVTDMKDAVSALNWCVGEMERRYKLMTLFKVRKIDEFNRKVLEANERGEDLLDPLWRPEDSAVAERAPRLKPLPLIVIVADEFADMIMQVGKKAEELITRLAQKSRAAGIHLMLATQRPSVDVITGLIKANIPTRVALRVNSKIDSRTILDAGGAEDMLGHGDMLFLAPGKNEPERVHGAFISDDEVNRICDAWRERGSPDYVDDILNPFDEENPSKGGGYDSDSNSDPERDAMYDQVVAFVLETRKVSASSIQRKFSLGYNRAARLVDAMEAAGIVSGMNNSGKREILM